MCKKITGVCMEYQEFLNTKRKKIPDTGIELSGEDINSKLFIFQRDFVKWASRKGRAGIYPDTGLGKTFIQLELARLMSEKSLLIAPLSVARQTVREGKKINVDVNYCRSQADIKDGVNITNYEMIHGFNGDSFDFVGLDEASILKGLDGKIRRRLTDMFRNTPYKYCFSATPNPNDIAEIAQQAEFLGVATRQEMLAAFFVHDDSGWRLKGWAGEGPFYEWLASWAMSIRKPSDLGYDDTGYDLPPLNIIPVYVNMDIKTDNQLFFTDLKGVGDRARVRKSTVNGRIEEAVKLINSSNEQWIVWCGLNDEADKISRAVNTINVQGNMDIEIKIKTIENFQDGNLQVLVTKPKIGGMGLNLQSCHNMIFLGLSDSYESYYQCIRRCYRFGQTHPVNAYVVLSTAEQAIYRNVLRKEREVKEMTDRLISHVKQYEKAEISTVHTARIDYKPTTRMIIPSFLQAVAQ